MAFGSGSLTGLGLGGGEKFFGEFRNIWECFGVEEIGGAKTEMAKFLFGEFGNILSRLDVEEIGGANDECLIFERPLTLITVANCSITSTKSMKPQNTCTFKTTKAVSFIFSLAIALFSATAANAASLKVLWYGQTDAYNATISEIANKAPTFDPEGDGSLEWDLTIWNPLDPAPDFSDYDVFAIGTGGANASVFDFDPTGILNNKEAISAARGNRTFLTGQDADNHYRIIGLRPDGPFGFLVNAVNWAGSGEGMGIVSLPDGWFSTPSSKNRRWWLNDRSFLKDELEGYVSYFKTDSVVIPTATSDFPVNEGLTTAGLSNWRHSSHAAFDKDIPGYLSINDAGSHPGYSVTFVTASEADGGTLGPKKEKVPEPSSMLGLFALGGLGVRSLLKRKSQ